ncbi:septum formation family protein [Arthrobacter sp. EH-1B-1]|uniref:Septum formation family protein n=1 Tax=Arthrobacter vasquezii TaxID=2977629 RepID=A0ABT6CTW6_9MICC|nr:septum formation family protein [Arthrobacter vasquezii]MDF9277491.1 septum formation family protein [Arthrobacter vasquezii]
MTTAALRRFLLPAALIAAAAVTGCTAGNDDGASPSELTSAASSEAAEAQKASSVTANDLQEGQCVTDSGTAAEPDIQVIPCDEPHAFEVFATTELDEGIYPGLGEADAQAQEFCRGEFAAFVGVEYDASALELQYFYPVESEWTDEGGRSVICLVGSAGGEPSTGTLRDSSQ